MLTAQVIPQEAFATRFSNNDSFRLIADTTQQYQQIVINSGSMFSDLEPFLNSPVYIQNALGNLTTQRASIIAEAVSPGFNIFAQAAGLEVGTPAYLMTEDKIHRRLIPKSVALAGSLLYDIDLPEEKMSVIDEIAAVTYTYNTLIDTVPKPLAQILLGEMEGAMHKATTEEDTSGYLRVLTKIAHDGESLNRLKQVVIQNAMVRPSRFDLKIDEPGDIHHLAQTKLYASGFEICTWMGAIAMDSENMFSDSDRTVYEIMDSAPYMQLNNIGAIITRLADDLGDREENAQNGIFNVFNSGMRQEMIEAFCQIADVDISQINMETDDEALLSFMQIFQDKARLQLERQDLPESEKTLLKIFLRAAVITYVNQVGDVALTAQ